MAHSAAMEARWCLPLLRAFAKLAKGGYCFRHDCSSVSTKQVGSHCMDFHEILHSSYISKICRENSSFFFLISDKNNGYCTLRPICFWSYLAQFFLEWDMFQIKKKYKFSLRLYCWRCRIHLQQQQYTLFILFCHICCFVVVITFS